MSIDDHLADLRRLAEAAAASVPRPLDLAEHEERLVAEAQADLARRQAEGRIPYRRQSAPGRRQSACVTAQGDIDWARIEALARAVSARQRRR